MKGARMDWEVRRKFIRVGTLFRLVPLIRE